MLLALDPTRKGNQGAWVKLWRDFVWTVLRGVPAQREPYEARAERRPTDDGLTLHRELSQAPEAAVDLPSTYYVGAQAKTAEAVPFRDKARYQLLLHFWPFVAQVYLPRVIDLKDGMTSYDGYALAIPNVACLDDFVAELRDVLQRRSEEVLGYRPRGAVIDLPIQGALETAVLLRRAVGGRESPLSGLVDGYEIIHLRKDGNNVRVLYSGRFDPEDYQEPYKHIRDSYQNPFFVRARVTNLVNSRPWFAGFDRIAETISYKIAFLGSKAFRYDARTALLRESAPEEKVEEKKETPSIEQLVYRLVQNYVLRRLKAKYDLDIDSAKKSAEVQKKYNEAKEKIARDAFLAARSRKDADFAEYFTTTLCSVPHHLDSASYAAIAARLRSDEQRADLRTLTLLALSAVAWAPSPDRKNDDSKGDAP